MASSKPALAGVTLGNTVMVTVAVVPGQPLADTGVTVYVTDPGLVPELVKISLI
ncbi:hypothetical protein D3C72_1763320 [compost metagenome]